MVCFFCTEEEYKKRMTCGHEDVEWLIDWFGREEICVLGDCGAKLQTNQKVQNSKFWFSTCVTKNEFKVI